MRPLEYRRRKHGFTLIELMIVVAIIGILAGIAIPKFASLVSKGFEASSKGNLGAVRSALAIYYADTEGFYPADTLAVLTANSKYLTQLPLAKLPAVKNFNTGHSDSRAVAVETSPSDVGGWSYDNVTSDSNWGRLLVACTHRDVGGKYWTSF